MLSKSTEYAIRGLVFIQLENWRKKRPGVVEIARAIDAPGAFTAKILQVLTRHHLVRSIKGRGGGFFFTDKEEPSLYDVVHVMEGDEIFHKCGFGLKDCNDSDPCPLHERYKTVRDEFTRIITTETIHSMALRVLHGEAVLNRTGAFDRAAECSPKNPDPEFEIFNNNI
ncbi:MAG: RrF2 family transcriptional regulator [Mangrovibacterium sp.]